MDVNDGHYKIAKKQNTGYMDKLLKQCKGRSNSGKGQIRGNKRIIKLGVNDTKKTKTEMIRSFGEDVGRKNNEKDMHIAISITYFHILCP